MFGWACAFLLAEHEVSTFVNMQWLDQLENGEMLRVNRLDGLTIAVSRTSTSRKSRDELFWAEMAVKPLKR
jgi:hypothetical protein